jgi:haloalkane dehalogenase
MKLGRFERATEALCHAAERPVRYPALIKDHESVGSWTGPHCPRPVLRARARFEKVGGLARDSRKSTVRPSKRNIGLMRSLRTPEERFGNLPDYDFTANYVEIDGLGMHYVDEGPQEAEPVLLLHGEPTWSYLYRHMIPPIAGAGFRTIAPDLIGFGKSDKPTSQGAHTYAGHVAWMRQFLDKLQLERVTLVCQDWGSLIGLRVAAENEHRFARIVLANGLLPTGSGELPMLFFLWRAFAKYTPWLPIGRMVQQFTVKRLPPDVVAAYSAPFPSSEFEAGPRVFPQLVPTDPDDPESAANRKAWEALREWRKPFLTSFSDGDPVTRGFDGQFQREVPGAEGQAHKTIKNAGHFLQEEKGPELAQIVIDLIRATPGSDASGAESWRNGRNE